MDITIIGDSVVMVHGNRKVTMPVVEYLERVNNSIKEQKNAKYSPNLPSEMSTGKHKAGRVKVKEGRKALGHQIAPEEYVAPAVFVPLELEVSEEQADFLRAKDKERSIIKKQAKERARAEREEVEAARIKKEYKSKVDDLLKELGRLGLV